MRTLEGLPPRQHPVQGSAPFAEQAKVADPSIDALVSRMAVLEAQQRLEAADLRASLEQQNGELRAMLMQMAREKREAEEGLRAAQEELQKLRERTPVSETDKRMLETAIIRDAEVQTRQKHARFAELVKNSPKVSIHNDGPAMTLSANGQTIVLQHGENRISKAFLDVWEIHRRAVDEANRRDGVIRDRSVPYGDLEAWIGEQPDTNLSPRTRQLPEGMA